jgi:hypothetical protein
MAMKAKADELQAALDHYDATREAASQLVQPTDREARQVAVEERGRSREAYMAKHHDAFTLRRRWRCFVNRHPMLTPYRRPILTPWC